MLIIGCDHRPGFQQIAFVDTDRGELSESRLAHREEAEQFYWELQQRNVVVRVGMESSGHSRWFERLLRELQFELWIGDPAQIRSKRVRKQKTDRQDAQLILQLLMSGFTGMRIGNRGIGFHMLKLRNSRTLPHSPTPPPSSEINIQWHAGQRRGASSS